MNISDPIITAQIEQINTAKADKSFIFLTLKSYFSVIKSAKFSIAEFIVSTVRTKHIEKIIRSHSNKSSFTIKPKIIMNKDANK